MKAVALAGVLLLVLASCGSADAVTTTTAAMDVDSTTTSQPTTTSGSVETSTTVPGSTTTEPLVGPYHATVFMFHDSGGNATRVGPFLAPVSRNEGDLVATVRTMLDGLTPSEIDLGLTTAIPDGTALNGIEVTDGVATVDLSARFDDGGGTFSMSARLAQLVYTVTGYGPEITGVRLELDGAPVEVFSSEGLILDDPMTRASFEELLPGILVESPAFDDWARPPVTITGIAAAFEGLFRLEILDWEGNVVAETPVQADNGMGRGHFSVAFEAEDLPSMPTVLQIRVYELSAKDGSVVSERIQPFGYRMEA